MIPLLVTRSVVNTSSKQFFDRDSTGQPVFFFFSFFGITRSSKRLMHIVKGEACCCNHGDRYSCLVIAAAVWQKSPFFLFDMCCHHGDH